MQGRCERHLFEQAVDLCGRCGQEFCPDCLVYSFGATKPPYCMPCAVEAAGIRRGAGSAPAVGRKEQKDLRRRRDDFLAARAAGTIRGGAPVQELGGAWEDDLETQEV